MRKGGDVRRLGRDDDKESELARGGRPGLEAGECSRVPANSLEGTDRSLRGEKIGFR